MHAALQGTKKNISVRDFTVESKHFRAKLESSGKCLYLYSKKEERNVFGQSFLLLFKIKAGVAIPIRPGLSFIELNPSNVSLESSSDEIYRVKQKLYISRSGSLVRRLTFSNGSESSVLVKALFYFDPCSVHFSGSKDESGAVGVNAFNRGTHVVMDEVFSGSVRVAGSSKAPSRIYMTNDKQVLEKIVSTASVPDSTVGISSQPIVIFENSLEVRPYSSEDIVYSLVYSPSGIEDALAKYASSFADQPYECHMKFFCSQKELEDSFNYAVARLEGQQFFRDSLELAECLSVKLNLEPEESENLIEYLKSITAKEGYIPHSLDSRYPGILETSLVLGSVCNFLQAKDKRQIRKHLKWLKSLALFLSKNTESSLIGNELPQGWRRALRYGLPSRIVPEVLLAASSALSSFSNLLMRVGKPEDSALFMEHSKLIAQKVLESADESGRIPLFISKEEERHWDETIDQSVACYRNLVNSKVCSYAFTRATSEDFETGFGPRTVPTSNKSYFHPSAALGQIGGYWTRAALAHCILGYKLGLSWVSSSELLSISRMVSREVTGFGGNVGEIPYAIDFESKNVIGEGTDPVAAARLIEAVLLCELGLQHGQPRPPEKSKVEWMLVDGLKDEFCSSIFLSRYGSKCYFVVAGSAQSFDGKVYSQCKIERNDASVVAGSFYGNGQVLFAASREGKRINTECELSLLDSSLIGVGKLCLEFLDPERSSWYEVKKLSLSSSIRVNFDSNSAPWVLARIRQL